MAKVGASSFSFLVIVIIIYNCDVSGITLTDKIPGAKHENQSTSNESEYANAAPMEQNSKYKTESEPSFVTYNKTNSSYHNVGTHTATAPINDSIIKFNTNDSSAIVPLLNSTFNATINTKVVDNINDEIQLSLNAENNETSTFEQSIIDTIDVPENQTIDMWHKLNKTVNMTTDHHNYYNSSTYVNLAEANRTWNEIKNITPSMMLSQAHRRAMTVQLSFDFPFYGHMVRNVTVATGGFIYTGDYVHSWLAATQYIAPLMANFDTSVSRESFVRFNDTGSSFTVLWENVYLQDKQDVGRFTFSATLYKNGDITFTYFSVPISLNAIHDDKHPVKVGLSDAYIIDKVVRYVRRKTIYEYHRVNFADINIVNSTIIHLKALPTCLQYTDCVACVSHNSTFDCTWCPVLNRCSTGTDRKKHEWLNRGCDRSQITTAEQCPALGDRGNNATVGDINNHLASVTPLSNTSSNSLNKNALFDTLHSQRINKVAKPLIHHPDNNSRSMSLTLGIFAPIFIIGCAMLWLLYAYRNPHTKSGQLLIQYRPSQWSWRRGEARYTAATIHM